MYINVSFQTKNGKFEAANEVDKILSHSMSQRDAPCNQELELFHGGGHVQARAHACWRPVRAHIAMSLI